MQSEGPKIKAMGHGTGRGGQKWGFSSLFPPLALIGKICCLGIKLGIPRKQATLMPLSYQLIGRFVWLLEVE